MKKSELIQKLIDIEEEKDEKEFHTITLNYIDYLKEQKALIEDEDIELLK
jgi:hypothetical protein